MDSHSQKIKISAKYIEHIVTILEIFNFVPSFFLDWLSCHFVKFRDISRNLRFCVRFRIYFAKLFWPPCRYKILVPVCTSSCNSTVLQYPLILGTIAFTTLPVLVLIVSVKTLIYRNTRFKVLRFHNLNFATQILKPECFI